MKSGIVFTDSGPLVIVTCFDSLVDPTVVRKLADKGIVKFIAFELPIESVRQHYGSHFDVVCEDLSETDELRVLDYDGGRALALFDFSEYGPPIFFELPRKEVVL